MVPRFGFVTAFCLATSFTPPALAQQGAPGPPSDPGWAALDRLTAPFQLAQSYSCSPRKTCGQMRSCDEARWSLSNCSWGGRLDRDNDGVPCESICR